MNIVLRIASVLLLVVAPMGHAQDVVSNTRLVEGLIEAFNAQDVDAMSPLLAEDIAWLSVTGESVVLETRGKEALLSSMAKYFADCPTCRASLASIIATPGRVSAIEISTWFADGVERSQKAVSVYEFSNGEISRVYYFPAEP